MTGFIMRFYLSFWGSGAFPEVPDQRRISLILLFPVSRKTGMLQTTAYSLPEMLFLW